MNGSGTTDAESRSAGIRSPCIGICTLDAQTNLCRGCLRSSAEIGAWRDADATTRRAILERVVARRALGILPEPQTDA